MARCIDLSDVQAAIDVVERDGCVILKGFSSHEDVQKVNKDAEPYLKAIFQDHVSKSIPLGTARCSRLFGRSTTAREKWLQQPALNAILEHFLGTTTISYNSDDIIKTSPILSASTTMDIRPGEKAQKLHRDDFIWQQTHTVQTTYKPGADVGMGLIVAGVDTTAENGATRFVPGSHLWGHDQHPTDDQAVPAELKVGEAFLFLSSTAHGGGANSTTKNRTAHGFFFCRAYIRPEENHYLWWKEDEVRSWSRDAQRQAGYVLDIPFIGHCDEVDPIERFRASGSGIFPGP
ncbi:PhyH-domain-containing protein [Tothia fuscella]|uniref:PhyH-domain-containing protein n=1 Tax=Tothia fuscella TaxID=1048955 RepID=A0A9P4TSN5_9PEZI|nr:PhyH-domain-containing protein [Tothia fuscella]